jgi:hypothetical protein
MSARIIATAAFTISIASCFAGDIVLALAARDRFPVRTALVIGTILFASGGLEGFLVYRGMTVFMVAWLWPSLMQLAHTVAALTVFGECPSLREMLGSAIIAIGVIIAGWP